MNAEQKALFFRYCPKIYMDKADPFPVRNIGCTAFTQPQRSCTFPKWYIDPQAEGAAMILEYAIYFDYDIQHMYDLEHVWVALDEQGKPINCWCSFHGMRLRAAGLSKFQMDGEHPVLYAQPGKHALLPHPELFLLHPDFEKACRETAGGGVLIPEMLSDRIKTDPKTDEIVSNYIRENYSFTPTMEFVPERIEMAQILTWQDLFDEIQASIACQLQIIENWNIAFL